MIKLVRILLALVGLILIVMLAVDNRGMVELVFWPLPFRYQMPLYGCSSWACSPGRCSAAQHLAVEPRGPARGARPAPPGQGGRVPEKPKREREEQAILEQARRKTQGLAPRRRTPERPPPCFDDRRGRGRGGAALRSADRGSAPGLSRGRPPPSGTTTPCPGPQDRGAAPDAGLAAGGMTGVKLVHIASGNDARGLPSVQGVYLLFDGPTGTPLAVMDGTALTSGAPPRPPRLPPPASPVRTRGC